KMACERYGVDMVGGDTSSSMTGLTISITALGEVSKTDITYRRGAKANDLICVTGNLGAAYMGLQLLEREKRVFESSPGAKPKLEGNSYILERMLKPEIRKDTLQKLRDNKIKPTAMIDISDGLSSDLLHICKNSGVGCKIYADKIPIDSQTAQMAEEFGIEPLVAALNGGEDYELLFTIPLEEFQNVSKIDGITTIGHITAESSGANLISPAGDEIRLTAQGWNALAKE
ncbi:MAG: thiamine-phosphate kinase, partial [Bacteroidales bacterium]|nr:thiamine-phosphate kinase [Bacteroidales bacterium]